MLAEVISLSSNSNELQSVVAAFQHSLAGRNVRVLGVDRVQNQSMWQSYAVKRQTIIQREQDTYGHAITSASSQVGMPTGTEVSRFERIWLFHGTHADIVPKIIQQGFNRSFCGKVLFSQPSC